MTPALIVYAILAALVGITLVSLVMIVRTVRGIAVDMQRLHLQQVNIVRMLLKAGFRPAHGRDWCDDARATAELGSLSHTSFDWRRPE